MSVCPVCSESFIAKRIDHQYCTTRCKTEARRRRAGIQPSKAAKPTRRKEMQVCNYCKEQYMPKAANRTTFCSRACSFAHKAEEKRKRIALEEEIKGIRRLRVNSIQAQKRAKRDELVKRVNRCTAGCGRITHVGKFPRRCDKCIRKQKNYYKAKAIKEGKQPGSNARKRARHYGVNYEHVKPIEIAMKHGMKCALCKVSTPWSRRGTKHHNAPEIDHIIPISKGGDHVADNLQLLCRKCNGDKSNENSIGQQVIDI